MYYTKKTKIFKFTATLLLLVALSVSALGSVRVFAAPMDTCNGANVPAGKACPPGSTPNNQTCSSSSTCGDPTAADNATTAADKSGACTNGQQDSCAACPTDTQTGAYVASCTDAPSCTDPSGTAADCKKASNSIISKYVNGTINLLSILVGLAVVTAIILAGIQYAASGGDPQKAASAKNHITKAVIALIAYAFLYGFLQFILPGGIS